MKITQADAPTIRMECHSIQTNWCPNPTIFMSDALPGTTLPIYPGLGQAPNMLACIPVAWFITRITKMKLLFKNESITEINFKPGCVHCGHLNSCGVCLEQY